MEGFFNPQGIAVFGVSTNRKNVARAVLQNLKLCHYQGHLVGIGSREYSTLGVNIYPSIAAVKEPIDLAVIITAAPTVIPLLHECRAVGIRRAVIMTAGFKELKGLDDPLSREVIAAARELDLRFIGPNCQGVINTQVGLCLPFGIFAPGTLKRGDISLVTQSGTICWMGSSYLSHETGGVNKVVSIGNKLNLDEIDFLRYLMQDDSTRLIILHLESTERGRELFEVIRESPKPVILFKTQIHPQSHQVAYSHTAALADDDRLVEGACRQYGALRARTFSEMIEMAKALSLPPLQGNRLGIISASGGAGIMAADACQREGMVLAKIPDSCLAEISHLPKTKLINLTNPVDTGNIYDSKGQFEALRIIAKLEEVDGAILSQFHPETGEYFEDHSIEDIVHDAVKLSREVKKPIAVHFLCDPLTREKMKAHVAFPLFDTIEDAVAALKYLWKYRQLQQKAARLAGAPGTVAQQPFPFNPGVHPDRQGFELLARYGIPCEVPVFARDEAQALEAAPGLGYPVVLKAISPDFTHKRAAGAVVLGINNDDELKTALDRVKASLEMRPAKLEAFVLQKMAPCGWELFLGGKHDQHYGPVVMLGRGGTDVESQDHFATALAPLSPDLAHELLVGFGGGGAQETPFSSVMTNILVSFSQLLMDNPNLAEVDLNPVRIVPETGTAKVLDVRLLVKEAR